MRSLTVLVLIDLSDFNFRYINNMVAFCFSELFYTEKTHVKNLKILKMLFYKPMVTDNVNDNLTKALFPNIEEMLALHSKYC